MFSESNLYMVWQSKHLRSMTRMRFFVWEWRHFISSKKVHRSDRPWNCHSGSRRSLSWLSFSQCTEASLTVNRNFASHPPWHWFRCEHSGKLVLATVPPVIEYSSYLQEMAADVSLGGSLLTLFSKQSPSHPSLILPPVYSSPLNPM